ncbi:hypothetical protein TOT_020000832 [Theileria orientalis strain Shintoku]|uniref:Uncharacterized protein n=1 Tax=Theileria orientalis strain Shintoku TaxID=869250 RepID=J4CD60_THEOR|nr:hypothetical protein TOT_020000832 [Theileria orientalis strain Shintoku]PVC51719.1 hypothetical protein MACL_00001346 [Theileria orientalis]BAM40577.1 hypothetical protein TOT_020000832 [Theileria orientalis strain Shintoku]|eukprot:XP_009690878.1 hypothetical protein TOT_020000832 [Theileria orientalis strain Shintoku]
MEGVAKIPSEIGNLGFENTKKIIKWWIDLNLDPHMESNIFTHHKTLELAEKISQQSNTQFYRDMEDRISY